MSMEFYHLESFIYVADNLSFTKAADLMFISQPAISSHIRKLEEILGTCLFNRNTKGVSLTPEGKKFYTLSKNIINMRKNILLEMGCNDEISGLLEIYSSTTPLSCLVLDVIKKFNHKYPNVTYHLHSIDSKKIINLILEAKVDFGIIGTNTFNNTLKYIPIADDEIVLFQKKGSIYANSISSIDDLRKQPLIIRKKGSATREVFLKELEKNDIEYDELNIFCETESNAVILSMVEADMGIGFLSKSLILEQLNEQKIEIIHLENLNILRSFYFVYSENRVFSKLNQVFSELFLNLIKSK